MAVPWLRLPDDIEVEGAPTPATSAAYALTSRLVRQHVARELHDRVVQTLQQMLVEMETFRLKQPSARVQTEVGDYQRSTREAINELRDVLYQLREEPSVERGLVDGIRSLLARYERRSGIPVQLVISPRWPAAVRTAAAVDIRRIVEEALHNTWRHSSAERAKVVLGEVDASRLLVMIRDYGQGLGGLCGAGAGIRGMRERAVLLGGQLSVQSVRSSGTVVRAVFPRESVI